MSARTRRSSTKPPTGRMNLDQALIALFIGAMNANGHVAPDELARAHHLIWSTRRFRDQPGETVGRLIDDMRRLFETSDPADVIHTAARAVPARLRPAAFAVVADLLLADGKLEGRERRFLQQLASELTLQAQAARQIIDVVLLKNTL